jgi:membrane protease YdiL (CAAX protease family)
MNWLTHTTFLLIVIVIPLISVSSMRKLKRISRWTRIPDLTLNNLIGAVVLWLLALGACLVWLYQGGNLNELGLVSPAPSAFALGAAVIVIALLLIRWTAGRIRRDGLFRHNFLDSMEYVIAILPRSRRERNSFYLLSISAGIGEEVLYRGFVFAYLLNYLHLAWVVVISSLLFGIAHTYQGLKGIPQTGLIGLALALLYVYTGSLWAPMVLHAAIDLGYGYLSWLALQQGEEA